MRVTHKRVVAFFFCCVLSPSLWIHLRQRVEHVCAKKRADIAMTTLAILLMPNSYHYPPVKSLIAMPHSYDYPLVKSLIAMPNMTTL